MSRVIIAGGRDYALTQEAYDLLYSLNKEHNFHLLINGGATGVDSSAARWAFENEIGVIYFQPDWSVGKKAGPDRNKKMASFASEVKDNLVILFKGGKGTSSMFEQANIFNLSILDFRKNNKYIREL